MTTTTTQTQHTPGPWHVGSSDDVDYAGDMPLDSLYVQECGAARAVICEMDSLTENREANARLIAAAPDLLAALEAWVESTCREEQTGSMRFLYDAARAAIAKATT